MWYDVNCKDQLTKGLYNEWGLITRVTRHAPLVAQELLPFQSSPPVLVGFVLVDLSFVVFCRSLFVLWTCFHMTIVCLSFFDLRLLINLLVSSNFSCSCFIYIIFWHFRRLFWHISMGLTILSIHIGNVIVYYYAFVNFFCNISSCDILAYITKICIALIYNATIVHLLCQFHAGKVGFSAVCQAIYS